MAAQLWQQNQFVVSTDKSTLDVDLIHDFLHQSYWSPGIPKDLVAKAIEGSLCFGVYIQEQQVGFARVITDSATFAYLADVFILPDWQGQGASKFLMQCIMAHDELQGLRRFMLATADAHGLYQQYGFDELAKPERIMENCKPDIYLQAETA